MVCRLEEINQSSYKPENNRERTGDTDVLSTQVIVNLFAHPKFFYYTVVTLQLLPCSGSL